jgi:hypothetical protein
MKVKTLIRGYDLMLQYHLVETEFYILRRVGTNVDLGDLTQQSGFRS